MKTIIIPTDFSTVAENAMSFVNAIASRKQTRVVLVHTYYLPVIAAPEAGYAQAASLDYMEEELETKLKETCTKFRRTYPNVTYEAKVLNGFLVDVLPNLAKEMNADLIIMGTDGAYGLKQVFLGTNSVEVLTEATCPVLIIPAEAHFRGIEQIVFATDLWEEPSPDMLMVVEIARMFKAEISFVYIPVNGTKELSDEDWKNFYQQLNYDKISFHIQQGRNIEEGIRSFTEKMAADIVVMINYRRTFWDQLFTTSQTKQMAYHTKVPLLVLHA
ncbi:universal stress protein [Cytophagaceae bacterium YF14B1]|uniref:Universal stress protein n=1 Tax=Xanthocytophaga flava TaxID=3048013 RepID=A0AAE3QVB2_9BACT|nr:universal stress protein [Xanthocytophaga flavus]MDJ1486082.1 universal stress protein [Xanthocytophaga flavus]